jgi:hypothetical protein
MRLRLLEKDREMHTLTDAKLRCACDEALAQIDENSLIDDPETYVVAGYITLENGNSVQVSVMATADRTNWIPDKHAPKR